MKPSQVRTIVPWRDAPEVDVISSFPWDEDECVEILFFEVASIKYVGVLAINPGYIPNFWEYSEIDAESVSEVSKNLLERCKAHKAEQLEFFANNPAHVAELEAIANPWDNKK